MSTLNSHLNTYVSVQQELLGTQSELGVPTDIVPVDTAIDQLTDRPVEASEGETSPEADLEEATAAPLDADQSESGDSDESVR